MNIIAWVPCALTLLVASICCVAGSTHELATPCQIWDCMSSLRDSAHYHNSLWFHLYDHTTCCRALRICSLTASPRPSAQHRLAGGEQMKWQRLTFMQNGETHLHLKMRPPDMTRQEPSWQADGAWKPPKPFQACGAQRVDFRERDSARTLDGSHGRYRATAVPAHPPVFRPPESWC